MGIKNFFKKVWDDNSKGYSEMAQKTEGVVSSGDPFVAPASAPVAAPVRTTETPVASNHQPEHDLNSIEGIGAIPIPKYERFSGLASPMDNIEYILHRKATEHKKNERMDLAIACLRKANEIMPHSNFTWNAKDYLRIVKYMELDGQYEAAQEEEERLENDCPWGRVTRDMTHASAIETGRQLGHNLVLFTIIPNATCAVCAAVQGRVFSTTKDDTRFPYLYDLPGFKDGAHTLHPRCRHNLVVTVEQLWSEEERKQYLEDAKKPVDVDPRSQEEIDMYNKAREEDRALEEDRKLYKGYKRILRGAAPKSFSGFRAMKKANSKSYQKLLLDIEAVDNSDAPESDGEAPRDEDAVRSAIDPNLEAICAQWMTKAQTLEEECTALKNQLGALKTENNSLRSQMGALKAENASLVRQLDKARHGSAYERQALLDEVAEKISQATVTHMTMQSEINRKKAELKEYERKAAQEKTEYKNLIRKLSAHEEITFRASRGSGLRYKGHAEIMGETMNAFITRALADAIAKDNEDAEEIE